MKKRLIKILKCPLFIILILTLVSSSILFLKNVRVGGDFFFHISRIKFVRDKILSLNISGIYFINGFGYGEGLFYPDIFIYIPAIFYLFSDNLLLIYKLLLVSINFFVILSMYYSINKLTNSKKIGIICSVIYAFLPYRLTTLYNRSALGESIAFIFLPIIIYSFLELLKGKKEKYIPLALSMSSIILSHILSSVIVIGILVVIFLFNIKNIIKNKRILLDLLYAIIITILLTAFFIFPMFEQFLNTQFYVKYAGYIVPIYDRSLSIINIFTELNWLIPSKYYIPSGIGIVISLVLIIFIMNFKNTRKDTKFIFILSFVGLLMTTNLFPWKILERYLSIFQFPWRLLTVVTTLLVFGTGFLINDIGINKIGFKKICVFIALLAFSTGITYFSLSEEPYKMNSLFNIEKVISISWAEYLPIECPSNYILYDNTYIIKTNELKINSDRKFEYNILFDKRNKYIIDFHDNKFKNNFVELPIIYYKGYKVKINGKYQKSFKTESGLLGIYLNEEFGKIVVSYDGTFIQKISRIISILSLIGLLIIKLKKTK